MTSDSPHRAEIDKLLGRVQELLDEGKPQEALRILPREESEWVRNARGVCLLRLGDAAAAVQTLRSLVVTAHLSIRPEAPTVFKLNFATALLLSGNVSGGIGVLRDIRDEQNPGVQKVRDAVAAWKARLTFWQRLSWYLGGEPACPFSVDYLPGDLR